MSFSIEKIKRILPVAVILPSALLLIQCAESFDLPTQAVHNEKAFVASGGIPAADPADPPIEPPTVAVITHGDTPELIGTLSPGGSNDVTATFGHVYVNNSGANSVGVIDANKDIVIDQIGVGERPVHAKIVKGGNLLIVGNDGPSGSDPANDPALVALDDTISVIDTNPNNATFLMEISRIRVGNGHHKVAFSDETDRVAVTNISSGTTSIVDINALEVICTVPVGKSPHGIDYAESSGHAYVANSKAATGADAITIIDLNASFTTTGTGSTSSTNILIDDPTASFITNRVVVGDLVKNTDTGVFSTISSVTATQLAVPDNGSSWNGQPYSVSTLPVDPRDERDAACISLSTSLTNSGITKGSNPGEIPASGFTHTNHAGTFVYTVGYDSATTTGFLSVIDTSTDTVPLPSPGFPTGGVISIPGFKPDRFAITEVDGRIYVSSVEDEDNQTTVPGTTIAVFDITLDPVTGLPVNGIPVPHPTTPFITVGVGHDHRAIALSTDDLRLFVPNSGADPGTVSVIDTATLSVIATVQVGDEPNTLVYVDAQTLKLPTAAGGGGGHHN